MALINCPECGKQISDKALSCPDCGLPMTAPKEEKYEEFICCPYCGSRNLHTDQKGFSGGKALAGAVLTGGIGLLAGAIGSKDVQITCLKCSKKFKAGEARITSNQQNNDNEVDKEVKRLIASGSKLAAVKYYSVKMNCGLKEAKDKVDAMSGVVPSKQNAGCASIILLIVIVSGSLFLIF